MAAQDAYKCTLTEASLKKAAEELNEDSNERLAQLKQFTDWIEQEKKWLTAPSDPVFLLSFLRVRKFSQLMARETLINNLKARQDETKFFKNFMLEDPKVQAVLKSSFFLPMPNRDANGRQVCIIRPACLDISGKVYKMHDAFRVVFMILDYLLMDENLQVHGFVLFLDNTGVTLKHQSFFGDSRQKFLKLLQKTYPIRIKFFPLYNVGPFMDIVLKIMKAVMSEKIQKRIEIFSDMVGIYEKVGQSTLPLDYLPDDYKGESSGTCENIAANLITELGKPDVREWHALMSSGKYKVDVKKMPPRDELFQEAFRAKLSID